MAGIGAVLAAAIIAFDERQKRIGASFRTPVLAVAVGIYLPFQLSVPIFFGGLVAHFAGKYLRSRGASEDSQAASNRNGLLFASGLITGEALIGILLAVPLVAFSRNIFAIFDAAPFAFPGVILLVVVIGLLYRAATSDLRKA
jgi:putative OPT family oligopeptide transporter